jgi:hypothetical protein
MAMSGQKMHPAALRVAEVYGQSDLKFKNMARAAVHAHFP